MAQLVHRARFGRRASPSCAGWFVRVEDPSLAPLDAPLPREVIDRLVLVIGDDVDVRRLARSAHGGYASSLPPPSAKTWARSTVAPCIRWTVVAKA